jgi:hypothetical protein
MSWVLWLACRSPPAAVASLPAGDGNVVPVAEVVVAEPPPPPPPMIVVAGAPTEVVMAPPVWGLGPPSTVIDPNAWRWAYNDAIRFQAKGDPKAALASAIKAMDLVIEGYEQDPLTMLAITASEADAWPAESAALDRLLGYPTARWEPFWNGAIDAQSHGDMPRSALYSKAALDRGGDVALVAPFVLRAALRVGRTDDALAAWKAAPAAADSFATRDLVAALAKAGRCTEARLVDPAACPAP